MPKAPVYEKTIARQTVRVDGRGRSTSKDFWPWTVVGKGKLRGLASGVEPTRARAIRAAKGVARMRLRYSLLYGPGSKDKDN